MRTLDEPEMKLKIIYPDKPGFALLAYDILQNILRTFDLTGRLTVGEADQFSVSLGNIVIYSAHKANCSEIDQEKILIEMTKHNKPKSVLDLSTQSSPKEMADSEEFTDCFCSGE